MKQSSNLSGFNEASFLDGVRICLFILSLGFSRQEYWSGLPFTSADAAKSWLIGKDLDAGKDWGQEEKGMTEDEMVGWHHWLNGHEFGQTQEDSGGQGRKMWRTGKPGVLQFMVTKNRTRLGNWITMTTYFFCGEGGGHFGKKLGYSDYGTGTSLIQVMSDWAARASFTCPSSTVVTDWGNVRTLCICGESTVVFLWLFCSSYQTHHVTAGQVSSVTKSRT